MLRAHTEEYSGDIGSYSFKLTSLFLPRSCLISGCFQHTAFWSQSQPSLGALEPSLCLSLGSVQGWYCYTAARTPGQKGHSHFHNTWALGHSPCPGCAEPLPGSHKQGILICLLLNLFPSPEGQGFLVPSFSCGMQDLGGLFSLVSVLVEEAHSLFMALSSWTLFLHHLQMMSL